MDIPVGRLIWCDLGSFRGGLTLYLVIRPPILCPSCGMVNKWRYDPDGILTCIYCESVISDIVPAPCPCGDDDLMSLRVVQNNDWGLDYVEDQLHEFNNRLGRVVTTCKKRLEKELRSNDMKLLSHKESVERKRMLVWSQQTTFDPTLPIPQWIIDEWPY